MALQKATFGGGCFWGMERYFRKNFSNAIHSCFVGYAGGDNTSPTYRQVCTGTTGHAEVIQLEFDAAKASYLDLVDFFFHLHDPTQENGQGNDIGTQYRSVIFFHSPEQKQIAEDYKARLEAARIFPKPIATEVVPAGEFWKAEEYHQRYLEHNPGGYCNHRVANWKL
eukprot:TRINITY_DN4139_c0_g1_i1.p1 TRINITY_DN4139_c0_g1~~TRINITY_DN4139_c0_g1_i1.p1  ORF type:complete len:178 (+),score=39.46 TRINITY_DN4139_c0_g1_i1:31-534(+)